MIINRFFLMTTTKKAFLLPKKEIMRISKKTSTSLHHSFSTTKTSSSPSKDEIEKQLEMFPEYKTAKELIQQGKFAHAIPSYERIYDSLISTIGLNHPFTSFLLFEISNSYRYAGNYSKAQHFLQQQIRKHPFPTTTTTTTTATAPTATATTAAAAAPTAVTHTLPNEQLIHLHELLSVILILSHQFPEALKVALLNVEACEKGNFHSSFAAVYGMLGIAYLVNGNLHEAETFLQMACRWAETPTDQLISSANNGALVWYKLANEENPTLKFNLWDSHYQNIIAKDLPFLNPTTKEQNPALIKIPNSSEIYKEYLVHVQNGWLETIEEAQTGKLNYGVSGCGPMNMTGLQSTEVTMMISNEEKKKEQQQANNSSSMFEETLNKDVNFASAYAHVLIQTAELYEISGKINESSEYLNSAMKALGKHNPLLTAPLLGKILRQIGYFHMLNTQAVTAEGLYRSALEKLSSAYCDFDYRYHYDVFLTKGYYGKLLMKWDKRELIGENFQKESLELLKEWQNKNMKHFKSEKHQTTTTAEKKVGNDHHHAFFPLTSLIQFPLDYRK